MRRPRAKRCSALDALGNPMRREIVALLHQRQRAVGELAANLPVSRPAVSKHLRVLASAGLVTGESRGNHNVYRLSSAGFDEARDWLERYWSEALARFKITAENTRRRGKRG